MITGEPLGEPDGAQGRRLWPIARPPWTRLDTIAAAALTVAIAAMLVPHLTRCMGGDISAACSDYAAHVHVANRMLNGGVIESYFLYHLVVALFAELPGIAPPRAALLGTLAFHIGLGLVVYALARTALRARPAPVAAPAAALTALAMGLVAHGVALDWDPAELYLGFVGINSFHNPTINALKPFALLLLPYAAAMFTPVAARGLPLLAGAAAAAIGSTLAKPSYAICLLPALATLTVWQWGRGRPVDWRLGAAIVLPTVLTLAVQYQATYVGQADGVVVAPLAVLRLWGASGLLGKFVLSVLFPLAVAALFPFRVLASAPLMVAWTTFAWGAGFTYLLAESGPRMGHGNFGWSGEIALFVLFVASTLLVLRIATAADSGPAVRLRLAACALAFAVHLVSGILWYGVHLHVIPGEPFPYVPGVARLTRPADAGCFAAAANGQSGRTQAT